MSRKLASYVYVTNPETGAAATFGPDDDLPSWAEQAITNPKAWSDTDEAVALEESAQFEHPDSEPDPGAGRSGDYESQTVAELRAEVKARNEGRDDADRVSGDGNKADLVAALVADDEAHS